MAPESFSGIDTTKALRWARQFECRVENVRGTGEVRVSHPSVPRPVTINVRRRDAGRKLTTMLNHLARAKA